MNRPLKVITTMSAAITVALIAFIACAQAKPTADVHPANLFKASDAKVYKKLSDSLSPALYKKGKHIFAGGDAAYSVELSKDRALWIFGDSFFGTIKGGKRIECAMDRNSIALIDKNCLAEFYQRGHAFFDIARARDLKQGSYFWPGDGIRLNHKLYLFMHETADAPDEPPPFQFKSVGDHLLVIDNPDAQPLQWKWRDITLHVSKTGQAGIACLKDGQYLYTYMTNPEAARGFDKNPTALARIKIDRLTLIGSKPNCKKSEPAWQYFTRTGWSSILEESSLKTLWQDGASEMSVSHVEGLPGYFAFYIPFGGKNILMRHANKPEGPWSTASSVYEIPQKHGLIYYSAKAHHFYAKTPGEVILTYCNNTTDSHAVLDDASTYFPIALKVRLVKAPGQ